MTATTTPLQKPPMGKVPTEGLIVIRPYPNILAANAEDKKKTWGYVTSSGWQTINKQPVEGWNYMGRSLGIHGGGMNLFMDNEEHRNLYAIFAFSDQWRGKIATSEGKRTAGARFYFFNPEMDAQKYLADVKRGDEMVDMIRGLSNPQIDRIALWFSIKGSDDLKRASLRKMTEKEEGRKKLVEILLSPDRELLELIAMAESKGVPAQKEGLWLNKPTGIYYWNDGAIGIGKGAVTAHLKVNVELQHSMKQLYFGMSEVEIKEAEVVKNPVAQSHKPIVIIGGGKPEAKYAGTATDEEIIAYYNAQTDDNEKSEGNIARKHNLHWRKVKKILDDNSDKLNK